MDGVGELTQIAEDVEVESNGTERVTSELSATTDRPTSQAALDPEIQVGGEQSDSRREPRTIRTSFERSDSRLRRALFPDHPDSAARSAPFFPSRRTPARVPLPEGHLETVLSRLLGERNGETERAELRRMERAAFRYLGEWGENSGTRDRQSRGAIFGERAGAGSARTDGRDGGTIAELRSRINSMLEARGRSGGETYGATYPSPVSALEPSGSTARNGGDGGAETEADLRESVGRPTESDRRAESSHSGVDDGYGGGGRAPRYSGGLTAASTF